MASILRASVTADSATTDGADPTVLIDGSDTAVTASGIQHYAPTPGDRLLVQQVGGVVEVMQWLSRGTVPWTADSGNSTYHQATDPSLSITPATGDIWYDTSGTSGVVMRRWNGTGWDAVVVGPDGTTDDVIAGKQMPLNDTMVLEWGTANPFGTMNTTLEADPELELLFPDTTLPIVGLCMDGTNVTYFKQLSSGSGIPYTLDLSTGIETKLHGACLTGTNGEGVLEYVTGITKIGTDYWMLGLKIDLTGSTTSYILQHRSSAFAVLNTYGIYGPDSTNARMNYYPALGTDGTNPVVCYIDPTTSKIKWETYNVSTGALLSTVTSSVAYSGVEIVHGCAVGTFDLGATRYLAIIQTGAEQGEFISADSSGTVQAAEGNFTITNASFSGGLCWDGSRFVLGNLGPYTFPNGVATRTPGVYRLTTQTADVVRYLAYTWSDAGRAHETALSPITAAVTVPKRLVGILTDADVGGTHPPVQGDTGDSTQINVINLYGSSVPSGSANFHLLESIAWPDWSAAGFHLTVTTDLTGAVAPAASTFPVGASGAIESTSGGFIVEGDGTGAWPYLQDQFDQRYIQIANPITGAFFPELVGGGMMWFNDTIPTGFLDLNGQQVNIADYPKLFDLFGHTFNGGTDPADGTFHLPDFRARFPVGVDSADPNGSVIAVGGFETDGNNNGGSAPGAGDSGRLNHQHTHSLTVSSNVTTGGGSGQHVTSPTTSQEGVGGNKQNHAFLVVHFIVRAG